jgi:hypothetical protein
LLRLTFEHRVPKEEVTVAAFATMPVTAFLDLHQPQGFEFVQVFPDFPFGLAEALGKG